MLSVERVGVELGGFSLEVSLVVPAGSCLAIVGASGAGKTTLLRAVAGLTRPSHGRVTCDGELWSDAEQGSFLAPERRGCGYVFQEYALFPHLSAWRNVSFPMRGPAPERRRRAGEILDGLGLADRADARPRALSGGERQRVALGRALALEPRALLLDEPLSALDASTRRRAAQSLAAAIDAAGVPTLLVTHDFAEAAMFATQIGVIHRGRIVQSGTAAELAAAPGSAWVAELVGAEGASTTDWRPT